ncbi:uncharacterized protein LOC130675159 [Microplitis mediator]|uniref:uncharacterized protein LOC130675159 n=1 Tax=Microplitis mediator TaxID=375433 RepID=UPI002554E68A|nr:uncharacterized protein LOC130675159 [Microplitis mediator]
MHHPRNDYKELLNLCCIFLGGIPSTGIKFKVPGAAHHARWLAKAIYCLKIYMFKSQFHIRADEVSKLRRICLFIVKIYIKGWFSCPSAIKAPNQDLNFLQDLIKFKNIDVKISDVTAKKFANHLWYLSEEIASLAFFDNSVPQEVKSKMVEAIKTKESQTDKKRIDVDRGNLDLLCIKNISDFITKKSMTLFEQFELSSDFLNSPPSQWLSDQNYLTCLSLLQNVKVVNDIAERVVALVEEFVQFGSKDEEQKQYLWKIVQYHRKLYPSCNK